MFAQNPGTWYPGFPGGINRVQVYLRSLRNPVPVVRCHSVLSPKENTDMGVCHFIDFYREIKIDIYVRG